MSEVNASFPTVTPSAVPMVRTKPRRIEATGTVLSFDVERAHGYIECDQPDIGTVVLKAGILRRAGHTTIFGGSRLSFELLQKGERYIIYRITRIDHSEARRVNSDVLEFANTRMETQSGYKQARISCYKRDAGYGFLSLEDGTGDVFFHIKTVVKCGLADLYVGQPVLVRHAEADRGLIATEIISDRAPGKNRGIRSAWIVGR